MFNVILNLRDAAVNTNQRSEKQVLTKEHLQTVIFMKNRIMIDISTGSCRNKVKNPVVCLICLWVNQ